MSVTRKFILLAALGIPVLAVSIITRGPVNLFIAYNSFMIALLTLDYIISPKANDENVEVAPQVEDKLFFKSDNTVSFIVRNNCKNNLKLTLKDGVPDRHFEIIDASGMAKAIKPGEETAFSYIVRPIKRGAFHFSKVYGFAISRMGFCRLYFERDMAREFKVYPNLRDLSRYRLIAQNKRILPQGERAMRVRGLGTEFESLREYVEGDDFRNINWMATARDNKIIVNQYQRERNQPIFSLIDAGRPMSYSVKGYKKLDYAINAALILSDIVNQQGDNSGLMVFDTEVRSCVLPGKGDTHRNRLMETLYHVQVARGTSDYEGAFIELLNRQKRSGLVFLFTDFETPEQALDLADNIQLLKKRHALFIVLIQNDSLMNMASGDNAEPGRQAAYRRAAAIEFLAKRRSIIKKLNARGVACIETPAEDFALAAVNSYLAARR